MESNRNLIYFAIFLVGKTLGETRKKREEIRSINPGYDKAI